MRMKGEKGIGGCVKCTKSCQNIGSEVNIYQKYQLRWGRAAGFRWKPVIHYCRGPWSRQRNPLEHFFSRREQAAPSSSKNHGKTEDRDSRLCFCCGWQSRTAEAAPEGATASTTHRGRHPDAQGPSCEQQVEPPRHSLTGKMHPRALPLSPLAHFQIKGMEGPRWQAEATSRTLKV